MCELKESANFILHLTLVTLEVMAWNGEEYQKVYTYHHEWQHMNVKVKAVCRMFIQVTCGSCKSAGVVSQILTFVIRCKDL